MLQVRFIGHSQSISGIHRERSGGIGQPLSLLLKANPAITEVRYDASCNAQETHSARHSAEPV